MHSLPTSFIRGQLNSNSQRLSLTLNDNLPTILVQYVTKCVVQSEQYKQKLPSDIPRNSLRRIHHSLVYLYATYPIELWGRSYLTQLRRLRMLAHECLEMLRGGEVFDSYGHFVLVHLNKFMIFFSYTCV